MSRDKRKLLSQLEASRRNRPIQSDRIVAQFARFSPPPDPSTIAAFAQRLRVRPATLIASFVAAGIRDLSPLSVLRPEHLDALLAYYKSARGGTAEEIYRAEAAAPPQLLVVQSINERLLEQLARSPSLMHELGPRKFEELVARLLEDQGCEVSLTKQTRDGGYDILGRVLSGPSPIVFLAECKRYAPNRKVGVELVRNLFGVTELQQANFGLLVTTSSFTKDAQSEKLRMGPRMDLKDFEDLKNWLRPYTSAA